MDPLTSTQPVVPASSSTSQTSSQPTPSQASAQAFQMALSYALNPPNVLGTVGGDDDDDDDGSSLSVGNSISL